MANKKTPEEWVEIIKTVHSTWKMANTLAKALARRYSDRWQVVDFLGPAGHESAGIVDIIAIRKSGKKPRIEGLKPLDIFDIIVIQVKGGGAGMPKHEDVKRLKIVKENYSAQAIVLFEWNKKKQITRFSVLDTNDAWIVQTSTEIFGKPKKVENNRVKTSLTANPLTENKLESSVMRSSKSDAAVKAWVTRKAAIKVESK